MSAGEGPGDWGRSVPTVALAAGLGFLVWFAGWGWAIGLVWKKAELPDYATWGRFYRFWIPIASFLFTAATIGFALGDARGIRRTVVRQIQASFSLLAFLWLAVSVPRGALHLWLGSFLVGSILVRGAMLFRPLWRQAAVLVPSRAASLRIFIGSALVYVLLVPWVVRTLPLAGDEPHYLLISHSVLVDRDFDLRNNYERGDYRAFHAGHLSPQAPYPVSVHGVGFPLVLLPGYALAGRQGATWMVALAAALLSLNIYWFCLELSLSPRASLGAWALSAFSVPVVTYANQLFPEIPAALGSLYAYRQFRTLPASGSGALLGGLAATFGVVLLKVRYAPLVLVLWLALFVRLARNRRWLWGGVIALLSFLAAVPLLDAAFFDGSMVLRRWGNVSAVLAMARPNLFHVIGPVGLLLDQKNGLLMYSPIYMLSFVGLALSLKDRRADGLVITLAGVVYLYVLIAHSGERWHGEFSPAPRYLVTLVPLFSGPLAVAWCRCRGLVFRTTRTAFAAYTLAIAVALVIMPRWRFRTKTGQSMILDVLGQGLSVSLVDWFPFFPAATAYTYSLAAISVALGAALVAYLCVAADR